MRCNNIKFFIWISQKGVKIIKLSRNEIDQILKIDKSKRPASYEESIKIAEAVQEYVRTRNNGDDTVTDIEFRKILEQIGLEDIAVDYENSKR